MYLYDILPKVKLNNNIYDEFIIFFLFLNTCVPLHFSSVCNVALLKVNYCYTELCYHKLYKFNIYIFAKKGTKGGVVDIF